MKILYVISGVTGMTGNELVRQLINQDEDQVEIIGFDNFYASSIDTVKDCLDNDAFTFFEYDLNDKETCDFLIKVFTNFKVGAGLIWKPPGYPSCGRTGSSIWNR